MDSPSGKTTRKPSAPKSAGRKTPAKGTARRRPRRGVRKNLLMDPDGPLTRAELVALRRDIHRHPEIGFEEERTSALVRDHLEALGLKPKVLAKTGVSALLNGGAPGRTLMLRCDLDALPMAEENTFDYRSENPRAMHACGHDLHTAIMLGTAKSLVHDPPARGRVKLLFQPAEEGMGGADAMIEAGVMEYPKVEAVLGYHIWNYLPLGKVAVITGPAMAAVDRFQVVIHGAGGHAAYPHRAVDPVVAAAQVITALQSITSRNVNPVDTAVVTVGRMEAGTAFNIIPPEAYLEGTVRTFTRETGRLIPKRFKEVVMGVAKALGCSAEIEYAREHEAVVNDAGMAEFMRGVVREVMGKRALEENPEPSMGGEDHSAYQGLVPGCYVFIGAAAPDGEAFPHHHPRFNPSEDVLEMGVAIMTEAAKKWLTTA